MGPTTITGSRVHDPQTAWISFAGSVWAKSGARFARTAGIREPELSSAHRIDISPGSPEQQELDQCLKFSILAQRRPSVLSPF